MGAECPLCITQVPLRKFHLYRPHQAAAPRRGLSHISTHIFCFPLAHFRRLRYN